MSRPKVLITNRVPDEHLEPLLGWADILQGSSPMNLMKREEVLQSPKDLQAIINYAELHVDDELLSTFPNLKIIASASIGIDHLNIPLLDTRGIWATNVPNAFVTSTADCAMGLLLTVARRIGEADSYIRSGRWAEEGFQPGRWDGLLLEGKTMGIIGFGKIGRAIARRAEAFGMKIRYYNRSHSIDPRYGDLVDVLQMSDVCSLHVPLSAETRGMMDASKLALLPRGAILLNLSRGGVVDEKALVKVLQSGHLAGAGLDVFENEPKPHPGLLEMNQVVMTPHIGGGTRESRQEARLLCAENIARALKGHRPLTPVNKIKVR